MTGDRHVNKNKDKRTHTRQMLVTRVAYKVVIPLKGETLTQNISEGGLCLILNRELSPGTTIELRIELPDKDAERVEIFAEVVWQEHSEMGFITGLKLGS